MAQSNSDGDTIVGLRKLRVMLRDPENGAMVIPFMQGAISLTSTRGFSCPATVLELTGTLLRRYAGGMKRDGSSSAGAMRVVAGGMTTRQGAALQEGEGSAAEERVHDPDGVSDLDEVRRQLVAEGNKATQVAEAANVLLHAARDALGNPVYGLRTGKVMTLGSINESIYDNAYKLLDVIFRALGPLEVMTNGLTFLIAADRRHAWQYDYVTSTAKLEDLSKTLHARLDEQLPGVSAPLMRARSHTLQLLSYLKSQRYKLRPGNQESTRAAVDAKAGIVEIVTNPRITEERMNKIVHDFVDFTQVTFDTHRFESSGLEDEGTAMAAGDGGGGGDGGPGGGPGAGPGASAGAGASGSRGGWHGTNAGAGSNGHRANPRNGNGNRTNPRGGNAGGGWTSANVGANGNRTNQRSGNAGGSRPKGKGKAKTRADIKCFKCGKMGHFANDCTAA